MTVTDKANQRHVHFRKKVHFCERVLVRASLSLDSYTQEEKNACWFQRTEYEEILRKNLALICHTLKDRQVENKATIAYCTRGLEKMFDENQTSMAARYVITQEVLNIQDVVRKQHAENHLDNFVDESLLNSDVLIASISQKISKESQQRAVLVAQHDYVIAKTCLRSKWKSKSKVFRSTLRKENLDDSCQATNLALSVHSRGTGGSLDEKENNVVTKANPIKKMSKAIRSILTFDATTPMRNDIDECRDESMNMTSGREKMKPNVTAAVSA